MMLLALTEVLNSPLDISRYAGRSSFVGCDAVPLRTSLAGRPGSVTYDVISWPAHTHTRTNTHAHYLC